MHSRPFFRNFLQMIIFSQRANKISWLFQFSQFSMTFEGQVKCYDFSMFSRFTWPCIIKIIFTFHHKVRLHHNGNSHVLAVVSDSCGYLGVGAVHGHPELIARLQRFLELKDKKQDQILILPSKDTFY